MSSQRLLRREIANLIMSRAKVLVVRSVAIEEDASLVKSIY